MFFICLIRRIRKPSRVGVVSTATHSNLNENIPVIDPGISQTGGFHRSNTAAGISQQSGTSNRSPFAPDENVVNRPEDDCGTSRRPTIGPEESRPKSASSRSRYVKPAITLSALVLAMVVCVMPYNIYVVIIVRVCRECYDPRLTSNLGILLFCNPLFDAVFYGITQGKIRTFYQAQVRSCWRNLRNVR